MHKVTDLISKQWSLKEATEIFYMPFSELIYKAQTVHRKHFNFNEIQVSTLLNIKTGGCYENCSYCSQSAHHKTGLKKELLMSLEEVVKAAKFAKEKGSTRFCMGAAGRSPNDDELLIICEMIKEIKKLGLEACVTLGLLNEQQVLKLKSAGLDYYNHNIDTSKEHYPKVITTRSIEDRLETIKNIRKADIKICCGGILGIGETNEDRISMLVLLANLNPPPESIPINRLIKMPGTPLEHANDVDNFDFIRTIALARIMMEKSYIRLSAGREQMSEELQSLCFIAGANSVFYGEKLLTSQNSAPEKDDALFVKLGIKKLIN